MDGNRTGQGTYYWKDGDRFVGQFLNGQTTENGITTRKAISKLCISGDCNNGFGKFGFTNAVYEGYFKNGKREGKGKTIAWDGGIYEGDYVDGLPNGKGKYTFADGSVYDGDWVNSERTGKGVFIWGKGKWEGENYEGDWVNGYRTGYGKYTKKDGTIQEGKWINNAFQGVELASSNTQVNSQTSTNSTSTNSPPMDRFYNATSTSNVSANKTLSNYKFTPPPALKINYIDNRKMCCCCNEKYGQYKVNDKKRLEITEKILFSIEKLALYHKENGNGLNSPTINKDQIDLDLKKVQEELLKIYPNYIAEISIGSEWLYNSSSIQAKYGAKICSTERNVNLYENIGNHCSLKCKNICGSCR